MGLILFLRFSAFVQILPKGIINKLVAWELINVNCMMKALAFITYQGGNIKKGLFQQASPLTSIRATQRLFFVKYLFGEADDA